MTTFKQVPLDEMPRGLAKPIALIKLSPDEITRSRGIVFERVRDDLDDADVAVVRCENGNFLGLVWHLHAPVQGMEVLTNEKSLTLNEDLNDALTLLNVSFDAVLWTSDDAAQKH